MKVVNGNGVPIPQFGTRMFTGGEQRHAILVGRKNPPPGFDRRLISKGRDFRNIVQRNGEGTYKNRHSFRFQKETAEYEIRKTDSMSE